MTEGDIRGLAMVLKTLVNNHIEDECPPKEKAAAFLVAEAANDIVTQALVDLNRIASALEHIALKGLPTAI